MPRKPKPPITLTEQMQKIINARIKLPPITTENEDPEDEQIESLEFRIKRILGIINDTRLKDNHMVFFVMYDIKSNKVRRLVFKYLQRKGCTPIQRSIFLAEAPVETFRETQEDLAAVQQAYENKDSIIVLPVTTDYLRMMKIIGQHIEVDIITHNKSTIFF